MFCEWPLGQSECLLGREREMDAVFALCVVMITTYMAATWRRKRCEKRAKNGGIKTVLKVEKGARKGLLMRCP